MPDTILIVEDEPDLVQTLEYNLQREGYLTRAALSGHDALDQARQRPLPSLILLDLMLPDLSGVEVCRQLRAGMETRAIPVLMLTAKGEEIDRVVGFEVGADDYMVKPYSVRELLLRVKAILRRTKVGIEPEKPEELLFGTLRIDVSAHQVWVEEREIHLTALEFKLLVRLLHNRGRVQTRDGLLSGVWGINADVTTRTVDTHVKRLREKLGLAAEYVETIRGVGYRFAERPPSGEA